MEPLVRPKISFVTLLIILLAFIGVYPALESGRWGGLALEILLSLILFSSALTLVNSRRGRNIGLVLLIPPLVLNWTIHFYSSSLVSTLLALTTILFMLFVIVMIARYVFSSKEATIDNVFGALCIYLLLGMVWALIYSTVELHSPGSFSVNPSLALGRASNRFGGGFLNFLYFSYVTMTTLGYGDVSPINPLVQSLSILQAIVGQFYIATVIAALVASHIANRSPK